MKICSIFYKLYLASLVPVERIHFGSRLDEKLLYFLRSSQCRQAPGIPAWHVPGMLHAFGVGKFSKEHGSHIEQGSVLPPAQLQELPRAHGPRAGPHSQVFQSQAS